MAGLFGFLGGSSDDPVKRQAMTAALSSPGGLWAKLGAYRAAIDNAPAMEEASQILREAYSPAQKATSDFVTAPAYRISEGRDASFDFDTAQKRFLGSGNIGMAEKLMELQQTQRKALGGDRQLGLQPVWMRDKGGNLVPGQLSSSGGLEVAPVPPGYSVAPRVNIEDFGGYRQGFDQFGNPIGPVIGKTQTPDSRVSNDPEAQRRLAEARAEGAAVGGKTAEDAVKIEKAQDALAELNALTGALGKLSSPIFTKYQNVAGFFGGGDPEYQTALGEVERASGRMLAYVERLPGAATDGDRDIFMASAGVLRNANLPIAQRIAAAEAAKESFRRLVNRYGQGAVTPGATGRRGSAVKLSPQKQMRAIEQARAAVARGADKAAVNKRLREAGINFQVK